jgi:predicted nucleotidyltransferase
VIDLSPEHLALVRGILAAQAPGVVVWAFGSRVEGRAKPFSDLDLALHVPGSTDLEALRGAFEDSDLPIRVDLAVYGELPQGLRERVDRVHEVVQG